jgi:Fic family protein
MKIPEKAPDWTRILNNNASAIAKLGASEDMKMLLRKANKNYLYWDKFKHLEMPNNVLPKIAWTLLKLNRTIHINKIPLLNIQEKPFGFWLPDTTHKELHYIDQQAGGHIMTDEPEFNLNSSSKERYLISSLMEEAIASSQIEGAVTTRKVAKEMLRTSRKPRNKAEQMIINNYQTILNIKDLIGEPLSPKMIDFFQASMTDKTLDDPKAVGRIRNKNEPVEVVDLNSGESLYTPPPADQLPERIKLLCDFANRKEDDVFIHPVIKAILLHFWLAYDHPYVDGNGRTARALFYWYMLSHKYWLFEYLSISRVILRSKIQYARVYLYSEVDDSDVTYFVVYHLRAIHLALDELHKYLSRKQQEQREITYQLRKYPGLNYRQNALILHALKHPDYFYSVESHRNSNGVVYETARRDLNELVDKGFLEMFRRGKTFYFNPKPNLGSKIKKHSS